MVGGSNHFRFRRGRRRDIEWANGGEIKALARREASFVFLAFLLASLLSFPITPAKALPTVDARLRDCRMELLVDDLDFGVAVLESEGILNS